MKSKTQKLVSIARTLSEQTDVFYKLSKRNRMQFSNGIQQSIDAIAKIVGEEEITNAILYR